MGGKANDATLTHPYQNILATPLLIIIIIIFFIRLLHTWYTYYLSDTQHDNQGRSDGEYMSIYTSPKSVQVNFLWGRNDVRTAIEHEYWSFVPQQLLYPQNNFLATPLNGLMTTNWNSWPTRLPAECPTPLSVDCPIIPGNQFADCTDSVDTT